MIRKDWKSEMFYKVSTTAQLNDWSHNHMMQVYIYSCSVCSASADPEGGGQGVWPPPQENHK